MSKSPSPRALGASIVMFLAAAQAGATDATDPLSEIVIVSATRVAQPANQALEPVVVIDRDALENSLATDVGDLLRQHAGLDVARTGGPGQPLSLFIRGANSSQSIILLDGVRINPGTIALAPLSNMSPELLDRIEIVKGPRSAIYGSDAIGGVVNLVTREGGPTGADVMLDYGRYGTGEFAVDGTLKSGDTTAQAMLSGQQSAGFPTFAGDWHDAHYKNLSGTAAVATRVGGIDLGARYWATSGTTAYSTQVFNDDYTAVIGYTPYDERFRNSALAVHGAGDITEAWHARAILSRVIDETSQNQVPDYDHTRRDTLDLQNDVRLAGAGANHVVTFGAILASEYTKSLSYGTGYDIGTSTQNYYLQDQIHSGINRLLVAGGYSRHPAFGDHATWNAEYGIEVAPGTLLTAGAGTAFRAPSATDRFGYGGTPDLKPESSRNFEIGIKTRVASGQEVTIAAFQNTIDNLIVFINDPTNTLYGGENANIGRARIRGIEGTWQLVAGAWTARVEGNLQDPRDVTDGTELLRRSRHGFSVAAARAFGRAEAGIELLDSGPRPDVDAVSFANVTDGGYLLVALRGKLALTPAWSLTARLDNALDHRYQLANGYNTPGRAASVATRYSFR